MPPGATIVSVDLAGHSAKPASGADGTRIPLMRAGLPTSAPYSVSFVYIHAGTPFQKKGDIQMALPKMDVPIGVVNWEVFVPEQYSARAIDGNVIDARRFRIAGVARGGYVPVDYNRSPRDRTGAAPAAARVCCPVRFAAAFSTTRERRFPAPLSRSRSAAIGHRRFPMRAANSRSQVCRLAT